MPDQKHLTNFIFSTIAALALSACVPTVEGYSAVMNTWKGASEREVIARWGAPARTYASGGSKFLTYVASRTGYKPGTQPSYTTNYVGNYAYTRAIGGSPGYTYALSCETTFEIRNSKVVNYSFKGNDCTAVVPDA